MNGQFNTAFPTEVFDKISTPPVEPNEEELAEYFTVASED